MGLQELSQYKMKQVSNTYRMPFLDRYCLNDTFHNVFYVMRVARLIFVYAFLIVFPVNNP